MIGGNVSNEEELPILMEILSVDQEAREREVGGRCISVLSGDWSWQV